VKTLRSLVSATKNVEAQKEHENFLRKQFQAADSRGVYFTNVQQCYKEDKIVIPVHKQSKIGKIF